MAKGNGGGEAENTREWPLILALSVSALILLFALIKLSAPDVFRSRAEVNRRQVEQTMMELEGAIQRYTLRHRRTPLTLEDLVQEEDPSSGEAWMPSIPLDPWGTSYAYIPLGDKTFRLLSFGEDGQEGTEDDIFIFWPGA